MWKNRLTWRLVGPILASNIAGCATVGTQPDVTIAQTQFSGANTLTTPAAGTNVLQRSVDVFVIMLTDSSANEDNKDKALQAFRSGIAMLDLRCSAYLDALGLANQRTSNERRQVDLIGGFVAAISGLTGASAKQIAATSTAFSFTGSSMDAFTNAYLFSDAANSVTKLVRESQQAYLGSIDKQLETLDYHGAVALLSGYEGLCRPGGIRTLVDEAIAAAKIVAQQPGGPSTDQAAIEVLGQLTAALSRQITEPEAVVLYAWFSMPAQRTAIATQSTFITALLANGVTVAQLQQKLGPIFLPLSLQGHPLAKRWANAVALVPGAAPAPVPPPAPAPASGPEAAPGPSPAPNPISPATIKAQVMTTAPVVRVKPQQ